MYSIISTELTVDVYMLTVSSVDGYAVDYIILTALLALFLRFQRGPTYSISLWIRIVCCLSGLAADSSSRGSTVRLAHGP